MAALLLTGSSAGSYHRNWHLKGRGNVLEGSQTFAIASAQDEHHA